VKTAWQVKIDLRRLKALKVCGIYGTTEAVPFLRISFRTSEIRVRSGRVSVADGIGTLKNTTMAVPLPSGLHPFS